MPLIKKNDNTIHVDANGPSPFPEIARWLKDYQPPNQKIRILMSVVIHATSIYDDCVGQLLDGLGILFEILVYYCSGFEISPTHYVSATATDTISTSASARVVRG